MLVLIFAVASFVVFLLILVLLCLADTLESRHIRRRKRIQTLETPPATLSITQAFDPIFAVLWEAPFAALQLMESFGPSGISAARVRPIFKKAAARFPEIYDGYSFSQWLDFLEETHLISWNGETVRLTPAGRAFLTYRFVTEAMVAA
jgi:hypothetical protein